tara:strand:- start:818 stop:1780 length:963 start_codon:yes stop_codon:yes gene_type:complete
MKNSPIIIVAGEPNSIFLEIFFKTIKTQKFRSPLVLICSIHVLKLHMKKFNFRKKINIINISDIDNLILNNQSINLINVPYISKPKLGKITSKSNLYIKKSFEIALKIIKSGFSFKLVNGPISKKTFLKNKFLGITEYISKKTSTKRKAMLIYNKNLSVCPITTHLPINNVAKKINKKVILEKATLINNFYKRHLGYKPKIAITGLNPHCESFKRKEDEKIIKPAINQLINSGYNVSGPYAADTIFLKNNREKYNVIIGMYHDQVLGPLKSLYEFDAINITVGLPFIRISPDHGPNESMIGKNKSNPLSLIKAITFLDRN